MNQEKMMEFWRNTYENTYYQWGLTQHVYDYLEGKIDKLTSALTSGGKKYHSYYQTWITDELDGENHELARRMLVVISKIRSGGLITGSYSVLTDAETLLRIGYDFTSVVDATIHKFNDIPEKRIYDLAVLLLKFHPEESLSFADKLLTDEVETLIEKRKSTRDLYLAIYIASALVKADPTAYGKYIPAFIKVATKIKNNFTALLLYYTYDYSPELKELLLQQILTSRNAPYLINSLMKDDDQFIAFLQKIGSPSWPYYYIKTVNDLNSIDKASILFKLYQEDRATFMDLYQRIEKSNYEGDQVRFPYLLVIRLQNGETDEDPERTRTVLLALMKRLMNEYSSKFDFESQYYDEEVPLNEIKELYYDRAFSWGTAPDIIGGFSILYDYSSRAKRFIQLLLTTRSKSSGSYNNDVFTVGYFLRERENWLSILPKTVWKPYLLPDYHRRCFPLLLLQQDMGIAD